MSRKANRNSKNDVSLKTKAEIQSLYFWALNIGTLNLNISREDIKCFPKFAQNSQTFDGNHLFSPLETGDPKWVTGKQCRPRSDTAERGI